jgi:hypothetical protein
MPERDHPATTSCLSRLRAEHPAWTIERTPARRTLGYTAARRAEGAPDQIRTTTLTELENRLRGLDNHGALTDAHMTARLPVQT